MTGDQIAIGLGIAIVAVVLAVLRSVIKKIRTPAMPPAEVIEPEESPFTGAGYISVPLLLCNAWSFFKYLVASNANEQIVALLLWVANGVFWGVLLIAFLIMPITGRKRDDAG